MAVAGQEFADRLDPVHPRGEHACGTMLEVRSGRRMRCAEHGGAEHRIDAIAGVQDQALPDPAERAMNSMNTASADADHGQRARRRAMHDHLVDDRLARERDRQRDAAAPRGTRPARRARRARWRQARARTSESRIRAPPRPSPRRPVVGPVSPRGRGCRAKMARRAGRVEGVPGQRQRLVTPGREQHRLARIEPDQQREPPRRPCRTVVAHTGPGLAASPTAGRRVVCGTSPAPAARPTGTRPASVAGASPTAPASPAIISTTTGVASAARAENDSAIHCAAMPSCGSRSTSVPMVTGGTSARATSAASNGRR